MSTTTFQFDGETETIGDHEYTFRSEPDECMSIMDEQGEGVWCGRLEWSTNDRTTGYPSKPNDFCNGRSVKLDTDRNSTLWWEIPADMRSWKAGGFPDEAAWRESLDSLRYSIEDILEHGYSVIILESDDGFSAALGGVEYGADVNDFVDDLVAEIAEQREQAWERGIRRIYQQVGLAGFPV